MDLTLEINCDQTVMGLPPVTSAVFLIIFWKNVGVSEKLLCSANPSRIKHMAVNIYSHTFLIQIAVLHCIT
jgi:hypothetical protein